MKVRAASGKFVQSSPVVPSPVHEAVESEDAPGQLVDADATKPANAWSAIVYVSSRFSPNASIHRRA